MFFYLLHTVPKREGLVFITHVKNMISLNPRDLDSKFLVSVCSSVHTSVWLLNVLAEWMWYFSHIEFLLKGLFSV